MQQGEPDEGTYLTVGEVARILGVSPKTVSRWADRRLIPCVVTLGGHRRFPRAAVEEARQHMYSRTSDVADEQ